MVAVGVVGVVLVQACASESGVLDGVPPDVVHVYDDVGRLRAVTDPAGETVVYSYDEVGSLLAVERYPSSELSVVEVSSWRGEPGAQVRVFGTGFDRKPSRNTVRVAGAEAEVIDGSPVELTVLVPDGAETAGPVEVSVKDDIAGSEGVFEVLVDRAPVVEGFSPKVVAAGDEVTVTGRGFTGDPLLDQVFIDNGNGGGTYLSVVSASETKLRATVPPVAGSGPVSVATPWGTGSADGRLRVVPAVERPSANALLGSVGQGQGSPTPLSVGDVGEWVRASLGEPVEVDLVAGKVSLVSFRGRGRTRVGLDLTGSGQETGSGLGLGCGDVDVGLVAPGGLSPGVGSEVLLWKWCGSGASAERAVTLPGDGDQVLVLEPREGRAGPVAVRLEDLGVLAVPERLEEAALAERDARLDDLLGEPIAGDDGPAAGPRAPPGGVIDGVERFGVDLYSGMLQVDEVDLVVEDLVPLVLSRGHRPLPGSVTIIGQEVGDGFGVGSGLVFDVELDTSPAYQTADLVLADGLRVPYRRVSDGTGHADALFEHVGTPTGFDGSTIVWNGWGWDLTLDDGTVLVFVDSYLWAVQDPQGNRVTIERARRRDQLGQAHTGEVTAVHGPHGRWVRFSHDDQGRVSEAGTHLGDTLAYSYVQMATQGPADEVMLAGYELLAGIEHTDPDGELAGEITYRYDNWNRLIGVGDGDGDVVTISYDSDGRVARQQLADSSEFTFAYETEARTIETGGNGETTEVEVVTAAEVTDPTGAVRRVSFEDGHWVTDTWAAGTDTEQTLTAERDPATGFITALLDADGRRNSYGYDNDGYLTSIVDADGTGAATETLLGYDPELSLIERITWPGDLKTAFGYDEDGSLAKEGYPGGLEALFDYDGQGRVTSVTDPASTSLAVSYELAHRVTLTTGHTGPESAGGTVSEYYDAAGRLASVTDPAGNTTVYGYDGLDRLVSVTDPAGHDISFAYDIEGNLASLTDEGGNTTAYSYDPAGRLVERTDPAGNSDYYSYDDAGRLVEYVDRRGLRTEYGYDTLSRLTEIAFGVTDDGSAESTISYSYDPAGRLLSADDSAYGTVRLTYDDAGQLISEATPAGEVTYSYDTLGRRTSMTLPDGTTTAYTYDQIGALATVTQGDLRVSATRDAAGRVEQVALPNDVTAAYTYDDGRLVRVDYGDRIGALRYDYDPAGQRTGTSGSLARIELPEPVDDATYGAGNELTGWKGTQLVYDEAGNLTSDGVSTYTWDARGQLVEIDGALQASFSYDPLGRRVVTTFDGRPRAISTTGTPSPNTPAARARPPT